MSENLAENHSCSSEQSSGEKTPKVSVIVPVYKVEKYLPECIDSILAQTFTDFELILVDDGSPDNSGKICDDYAARDSRIRVFHKENGGVSSARNLGLDNARGEWIMFVDSDDWIESGMLNAFLNSIIGENVDFVYCCLLLDKPRSSVKIKQGDVGVFSSEEILYGLLSGAGVGGGPCCKLYRNSILNEFRVRFNEDISIFEDLLFVAQYIKRIIKGKSISDSHYHYVMRPDSAMNKFSVKTSRDRISAMNLLSYEFEGAEWATPLLNAAKNRVKFSVIRSRCLPRREINETWKNLPIEGVGLVKGIFLWIFRTPLWWGATAVLCVYNTCGKGSIGDSTSRLNKQGGIEETC